MMPPSSLQVHGTSQFGAKQRVPILLLGMVSLLAGLWGAVMLLGIPVPSNAHSMASGHGPLMALGFLGTVISLERAVALRRAFGYLAPLLAGLGGITMLAGAPPVVSWSLWCLAGIVLIAIYGVILQLTPVLHLSTQLVGGVCWYLAAMLWLLGRSIPEVVVWLAGFLVLTILGERLELTRVIAVAPASRRLFVASMSVFMLGAAIASIPDWDPVGGRILGVGLLGIAAWGARFDVARRTIRIPGLTRYMAICLLGGYVWLAAAGIIWVTEGNVGGSLQIYDMGLHTIFLGFVMAMIFGHAPVIVPAVLRIKLPYHRVFYAHLVLLHAALLARVAGDLTHTVLAWQIGGIGTEIALLLFIVSSAWSALTLGRAKNIVTSQDARARVRTEGQA